MIILFDLDGTLIDSTEAILESFHYAFDVYDYPHIDDEKIKALIGYPLDIMFERAGIQESMVWSFVTSYKEHYREISREKTTLLPHAREAVMVASSFAKVGIVTTKTGRYSQELMEHFGLMDIFEVLIGREDVEHPKPHAEPILKALEAFGEKDFSDVWMIGDTELDLISADSAGVNAIGVLSGYGSKEQLKKFTDALFCDTYSAVVWLKSGNLSHNELTL